MDAYAHREADGYSCQLLTHAQLMFTNECLGELQYEATTTAIVIAGAFMTFLLQYFSVRVYNKRTRMTRENTERLDQTAGDGSEKSSEHKQPTPFGHHSAYSAQDDPFSVLILEAGIIFHSVSK